MKLQLLLVSISVLVMLQEASASCGTATCPLYSHNYLQSGNLQVRFVYEYINQNQIFLGSKKSFVGAFRAHPDDHDEVQTINEGNVLQMQYGVLDRLGLLIDVPFIHREHSHIGHHDGEDHWESWNFSGIGDIVVGSQVAILLPVDQFDPYISLTLRAKLPTGVTDARNAEGEAAEVSLQPGSGSVDGIIGMSYRQTIFSVPTLSGDYSAFPLIAGVTYRIRILVCHPGCHSFPGERKIPGFR